MKSRAIHTPEFSIHAWVERLLERHQQNLTFSELRRGLQALSRLYVQKRERLATGAVFEGAGKRAAFAAFYAPLHFMLVRHVVLSVGACDGPLTRIVDLGCGTAPAGAAWALAAAGHPAVTGIDVSPWAAAEARWNLEVLGVRGSARRGDLLRHKLGGAGNGVVLGFAVNELGDSQRERLLSALIKAARQGARVLVVEPIAKSPLPWWQRWQRAFVAAGGRDDTWRLAVELPERLRLLDRAAGLDHRELTARTLYVGAAKLTAAAARTHTRPQT